MEDLLETIVLDIDENNELLFKVKIEGLEQAPAKIRLVCESADMGFVFTGHPLGTDDIVQFVVPALKDKLKEGTYLSRVEVMVENRYFAPVTFNVHFKKTVSVVAEAVKAPVVRLVPQVKVTATQVPTPKQVAPKTPATPARPPVSPTTPRDSTLQERYRRKVKTTGKQQGSALISELVKSFVKEQR
jgi:hypothetical protein